MSINPDEDTEFNDALRAHGIIPKKPVSPPSPSPPPSPTLASTLKEGSPTLDEIDLLGESAADSDEERLVASFKRQRLNEMKKESRATRRFGEIYPIGRDDYTREVTEASDAPESDEETKVDGDGWHGTGVVCFLYQDGEPASVRLAEQLRIIAKRHPRTKIVSIIGNKCIENYPDRHLPTLFLYRKGKLRKQFAAYGKDRERPVEELEVLLIATNMIDPTKASRADAEASRQTMRQDNSSDDDDDSNPPPRRQSTRPAIGSANHRGSRIKSGTVGRDSDDSDFDL